jgi:hypothetical protein
LALTTASARRNDHGQQWKGVAVIRCLAVSGLRYTDLSLHTVCSIFYRLSSALQLYLLLLLWSLKSRLPRKKNTLIPSLTNVLRQDLKPTYRTTNVENPDPTDGLIPSVPSLPCVVLYFMTTPHESSNVRFLPTQITTLHHTIHTRLPSRPETFLLVAIDKHKKLSRIGNSSAHG